MAQTENAEETSIPIASREDIKRVLGTNRQVYAAAVMRVNLCVPGGKWKCSQLNGPLMLLKDKSRKNALFFATVDLETQSISWEHELHANFVPLSVNPGLIVFESDDVAVGLEFLYERETTHFHRSIVQRVQEIQKGERQQVARSPSLFDRVRSSFRRKEKPEEEFVISGPSNVEHRAHVGFDSQFGLDFDKLSPEWEDIFVKAGITREMQKDKKMQSFILDFVKEKGAPKCLAKTEPDVSRPPPPPPPPGPTGPAGPAAKPEVSPEVSPQASPAPEQPAEVNQREMLLKSIRDSTAGSLRRASINSQKKKEAAADDWYSMLQLELAKREVSLNEDHSSEDGW